ncbi:MAG: ATP-binding protein, partial [Pyrobaculum sp.]
YATLFALAAALLAPHPLTALMAIATTALWGEWVLLWTYGHRWVIEPYREKVRIGGYVAAFDPRRKMYHILWKAEPTRSEFGISAAQTLHEMYASLALQPGEYLAVVQLGNERFVRYTTKAPDESRIAHIESVLRTYFVLHPTTWVSLKVVPDRWIMYVAAAPLALALFNPTFFLVGALLLYHARNVRRWYRQADIELAFEAVGTKRDIGTSRQSLETFAGAEATAIAKMEKWAVVFTPRTEAAVEKEFGKAYESVVEKRGVVVKLHKTSQLLERMLKYDERPIYMQVFGSQDLATQLEIRRDALANVLFWVPKGAYMTKALSHDLARAPIFYGGKLMSSGRELFVGYDKFGRPVEVDIDSMPTSHSVILGPSGMGKSWAVATLLQRLTQSHGSLKIVVVDPHGDYVPLARLIGADVYEVPRFIPPLKPLENSRYLYMLLAEFGLVPHGADGAVNVEEAVKAMAKAAGVEEPKKADLTDAKHVVWDLRALKHDSAAQAFFVSLILLWYLTQWGARPQAERVETVIVVDEAALLLHGAKMTETGLVTNTVLTLIRQLSMGGRKYGFALWIIAQLARHVPEDIIENAGFVLQLGGTTRALKKSLEVLALDRYDYEYLRSATTPRETTGGAGSRPYAMGVLYLSPRDLKYHVKIPLDPILKEAV